jgi:hypothetical protein
MSAIYLGVFFLTLAGLAGLGIFTFAKRRRELRMQLRLLHGRSQLLSEEIERQTNEVAAIDETAIAALRQEAEEALNMLNIAMVERQAHLLNYSDLAHLQRCKCEWLENAEEVESVAVESELPPLDSEPLRPRRTTPRPTQKDSPNEREHKDRSQIENQLLGKISQLNKGPNKRK